MTDEQILLVVLAGRPGTGKTTLAKRLAAELRGAYVRLDAIVGPMLGAVLALEEARAAETGYEVARAVARENLEIGIPVVVDGLHAVHARRVGWRAVGHACAARLEYVETYLSDGREHRRRVERRSSGESGYLGPSWEEVQRMVYEPWDEKALGRRLAVDAVDTNAALAAAIEYLNRRDRGCQRP